MNNVLKKHKNKNISKPKSNNNKLITKLQTAKIHKKAKTFSRTNRKKSTSGYKCNLIEIIILMDIENSDVHKLAFWDNLQFYL